MNFEEGFTLAIDSTYVHVSLISSPPVKGLNAMIGFSVCTWPI